MKKLIIALFALLLVTVYVPVYAEQDTFVVADNNSGLNENFDSLSEANRYYKNHVDEYNNLLLIVNDKTIKMEYGVVCFDDESDFIDYYSTLKKEDDTLCPSYGIDAAYLDSDGEKVYFKLSGDTGYTNIDSVTLIPYENLDVKLSMYHTDDKYLYHNIKGQLNYEYYASCLKIDFIPEYLNSNSDYYSYDGHYFYDNFYLMIDDYRNGTCDNAINNVPYFNYYQYLPYRSISNYDYTELEDYFYNTLGIDGKLIKYNDVNKDNAADEINRSQLYDEIDSFFVCQNMYGTNALMLLSSAIYESNYGKSYNSYYYNNLYYVSAYDDAEQTENDKYDDVANSIYSFSKYYINNRYANHLRDDYCGTFNGDKLGGIASGYCGDAYYGEKVAATYFNIDNKLGLKDYNYYSIGICDDIDLYNDESLDDYKYSIDLNEYAFVILDEYDNSYLIQIDNGLDDYLYDYENCVAYINKEDVYFIINNAEYHNDEYVTITYDFTDGLYDENNCISVKTKKGSIPAYIEPSLDGYEFIGYDSSFTVVTEDKTYTAQYKHISDISIAYLFEEADEYVLGMDLSKAYIIIKYDDGTHNKVSITSEMVSMPDIQNSEAQDVVVTYCGLSASKTITIDEDYINAYSDIMSHITNGDFAYLKQNIDNVDLYFTMAEIRNIDYELMKDSTRNYVIKDNTGKYDLSISGLQLALEDKTTFSYLKDTYYVEINDIRSGSRDKIENVAKGYDFDIIGGINIGFKFNFQNIDLKESCIVQLDIENKKDNAIYSVYHVDDNGDIIKCRTTWSNNYIQFMIDEAGDYLILSLDSVNTYNINDDVEDLSYANMGYDNHRFNLNVLYISALFLLSFIGVIAYYIVKNKRNKDWNDYRKSLQKVDTVLEEKPKN